MASQHDLNDAQAGSDSQIAQLLKLSGPRPMPDDSQMSRARAAAQAEWTRLTRRRRWRAWLLSGTAAAAVLAVASALLLLTTRPSQTPGPEVAVLEKQVGTVQVTDAAGNQSPSPVEGNAVRAGDRLETAGDGRAALLAADGVSIRLDYDTSVVLDQHRIVLGRGAVYVDSGREHREQRWTIDTPVGVVQHVGTQFEVRLEPEAVRVRVREGTVTVERRGATWTSNAGEVLLLNAKGSVTRRPLAASGPEWAWVTSLARPFRLEGATLPDFLDWASREQGCQWQFDDAATAGRFRGVVLHGSIDDLAPEDALAAVLATSGLTFRREGNLIRVSAAR